MWARPPARNMTRSWTVVWVSNSICLRGIDPLSRLRWQGFRAERSGCHWGRVISVARGRKEARAVNPPFRPNAAKLRSGTEWRRCGHRLDPWPGWCLVRLSSEAEYPHPPPSILPPSHLLYLNPAHAQSDPSQQASTHSTFRPPHPHTTSCPLSSPTRCSA